MATIKEDYCDFEIAKLLKEKGFKGFTMFSYSNRGSTMCGHWENEIDWLPKCTNQMIMKWLREMHKIVISIFPTIETDMIVCEDYNYTIYKNKAVVYQSCSTSYEEAAETAIKYCLENLI